VKGEECVRAVLEKPELRRAVLEAIKAEAEDVLQATLVEAIKRANERPPIWWQWLMILVMGAFGGLGLGIVVASKILYHAPPVP